MRTKSSAWLGMWVIAAAVAGCGGGTTETPDSGAGDGGNTSDAGNVRDAGADAGRGDGGADAGASDTGTTDTGTTDTGTTDANALDAANTDGGPDAAMPITFRIDTLDSTACTTIEIYGLAGDDRGGVAVSGTRAYVTGDDATVAYPLDLVGAASLDGSALDNLFSDLATGQLYALANDTGPIGVEGGTRPGTITRLVAVGEDGTIGTTAIMLSTPIAIDAASDIGIFAGSGELAIHDGANLRLVDLATGTVTDLGALDVSSLQTCENWAYYGVLEHIGTQHSIVGANGYDDRIVRIQVGTGDVSDIGTWTNLDDMCSISVSPTLGRWYFHNEYDSQFDPNTAEALGYCAAAFDTTPGNFQITALSSARCRVIEVLGAIGDDRGGIAVSASHVFLGGDGGVDPALGRWSLDLDAPAISQPFMFDGATTTILDGLVTNFHTAEVYSLATATELLTSDGGDVTRLVLLADDGSATSTEIALSRTITLPGTEVGIFSGWDELAIHDGTHLWHIALPSGTVTDLGLPIPPQHQTCESSYYFGVLEQIDGARYLTVAYEDGADPVISRTPVDGGTSEVIHTFTDINDMCSFSLSPTLGRWYFHHEGTSELTGSPGPDETLGFCGATFTHP